MVLMRVRIRGPSGQATVSLEETATVGELQSQIAETTSISSFDIKHGYPPKPLLLDAYNGTTRLLDIGINLDTEQLIVSEKTGPTSKEVPSTTTGSRSENTQSQDSFPNGATTSSTITPSSSSSFANFGSQPLLQAEETSRFASRNRKAPTPSHEVPEIPMPSHGSTMVLRIMPDDNSCLFRAFNFAFLGGMDNMHELRSVIAQTIQANRDKYTAAVLDKEPDKYCRWIQTQDAWGGGIELGQPFPLHSIS